MGSSEIIALGAMLVSLVGLLFSRRKEAENNAADFAKIGAQNDLISSGVNDIKVEMRTLRGQISGLSERLVACETRIKNLEKEVFK